jgi:hypothetical protein
LLLEEIRLHVKMTRRVTPEFRPLVYDTFVDAKNSFEEATLYKLVRDKK